MTNWGTRLEKM